MFLEENLLFGTFHSIDEVYTISSLSGFEALLRGLKVTTMACPFYSGWGLTNDLQPNARRNRKLTIDNRTVVRGCLIYCSQSYTHNILTLTLQNHQLWTSYWFI
ncbi:hypothetical protein [uncultured Shewanella sp.]|uniref:capsular polysaccharide export protein, LipB/KpsS family n=1 Tax=uncultured Shewanella sp. TaxID=173975 RepID=UPI0026263D7C|nr:hypothetical protein [uncultured Shewanella sp.]